jgi:UDP-glucose 4-epimerase
LLDSGAASLEKGDIRDQHFMERVLSSERFDVVYHLAALHYIPYCAANPIETLEVNAVGTQMLMQALKGDPPHRFVFASTGDVYSPRESAHDESDPTEPFNIYGVSKLACESIISAAAKQMPTTGFAVARLFNTYGPRETNPHLIPGIIVQLRAASRVTVGNTWPRRDYIDVRDVVDALILLGKYSAAGTFERFNVGTGVTHTVDDVVLALSEILGVNAEVNVDPEKIRPVERPHLQANTEKLRGATGWFPRYTLLQGLRDLCVSEGLLNSSRVEGQSGHTPHYIPDQ